MMGKGKGYVSSKDLLGGEPDPHAYMGFYSVHEYYYPPYWQVGGYGGVECGCWRYKGEWEWEWEAGEAKGADKM